MIKISNANSMAPLAFKGDTVNVAQTLTNKSPDSREYKLRDMYLPDLRSMNNEESLKLKKEGDTLNLSFDSTNRHNKEEKGRMLDAVLSIAAQEAKGMGANKIAMDTDLFFMANKETISGIPVKPADSKVVIPEKSFDKLLKNTDASIRNNLSEAKDIYQTKTRFYPENPPLASKKDLDKLFPSGTKNINFVQGPIGDCYYLSSIKGLSESPKGADILSKIIEISPDGKFKVTFPGFPKESFEFEEKELRRYPSIRSGDLGVKVLEHGLYKLKKRINWNALSQEPFPKPEDKTEWIGGGLTDEGMELLSNKNSKVFGTSEMNDEYDNLNTFEMDVKNNPQIKEEAKALLKELKERGDNVAVGASTTPNTTWNGFVAPQHAYAVADINPEKEEITLVNPWYASRPKTFSYEDFFKNYGIIEYVELDKDPPPIKSEKLGNPDKPAKIGEEE